MVDDALDTPDEDGILEELLSEIATDDPTGQKWAFEDTAVSSEVQETIRMMQAPQAAAMARLSSAEDSDEGQDKKEWGWPLL